MNVNFKNFSKHFAPATLNDFVFVNSSDKKLLEKLISGYKPFPGNGRNGILLYGEPGTGKSTLAALLPELTEQARKNRSCDFSTQQNCAAGGQTVASINNLPILLNFDAFGASYNYITLDEVDCLTTNAMEALKSVMDMGIRRALFFLTTNHINKISRAVRDRCYEINMGEALDPWVPVVRKVLTAYKADVYSDAQILSVISNCRGSGRQILDKSQDLVEHYYELHPDLTAPVLPSIVV